MIKPERRGKYDTSFDRDSLVVNDERNTRIALFVDEASRQKGLIRVAVDMPNSCGTRTYAVSFDWLLEHLRRLDPERAA